MRRKLTYVPGDRHGMLTVVEEVGGSSNKRLVRCKCDCGNEVVIRGAGLWNGNNKSCGCLHEKHTKEFGANKEQKHGMAGTRLYKIWSGMKYRCSTVANPAGKNYAQRGITICDEWKTFEPFCGWALENGYADGLSIDRIDVNGPYAPWNCRWVGAKQQQRNKRDTLYVEINGEKTSLKEYCETNGLVYIKVYYRIYKLGWPVEEAVGISEHKRKGDRLLTIRGETKTVTEWAKKNGIDRDPVYLRLMKGWDAERAVSEPIHKKNTKHGKVM